jgi:hypothetical protein
MSTPLVIPDELIRAAETPRVYLRQHWTDAWTEEPHLFCNHFTFTASPTIPSAEFEWRYGLGRRQADAGFVQVPYYADLAGQWVKVVIDLAEDEQIVWVGLIVDDHDSPSGALGGKPAGVQKLLAYGPELLLERTIIAESYYYYFNGDNSYSIRRGLTFNNVNHIQSSGGIDKKAHDDRMGNRSAEHAPNNCYMFAGDPATADKWSSLNIADYLMYLTPRDSDGNMKVPIFLDGESSAAYLPAWDKPVIATHGRTLRDVLNELMDRRRMLGYSIRFEAGDAEDDEDDSFKLYPFTYADAAIDLGDGKTYAANADQIALDFDTAVDLASCQLKESETQRYDQVIAAGSRIVCCGSISNGSGTLVKHWTDAQAWAYNAAASDQEGYGGLEQFVKDALNSAVRSSEPLRRVYSYFGLPEDWWKNGEVGCFLWANERTLLFPADDFELKPGRKYWYQGELRFLPQLPLKSDHDYSGNAINNDAVADNTPPGQSWHYRDIYAVLKFPADETKGAGPLYGELTKFSYGCCAELRGDGAGVNFSGSVQPQPDAPGVIIVAHGGGEKFIGHHHLAGAEFTPLDDFDEPGICDWRDLIVTFAMEADIHVEACWPAALPAGLDAARVLRIDASRSGDPDTAAGLHYVAVGTVVGLDGGKLVISDGGYIRDDRKLLERMARTAFEWYGRKRQAMTLEFNSIRNEFSIGQLIVSVGAEETYEPVRSVVTEIRIDLAQSDDQTHRTTIQTQWAELDVLKLF